jgi:predicted O-methyltransferase YrrM
LRTIIHAPQISGTQRAVLAKLCSGAVNALEIGVWVGESTEMIAAEVKKNGGHMYVIDWFEGCPVTVLGKHAQENDIMNIFISNMKFFGLLDVITIIRGDSRKAHEALKDDFFDFIYIDADHRYSGVSQDLKNYYPKLKKGGVFCGHDCESDTYDDRYIEDDYVGGKHHGVIKAVGEMFNPVMIEANIWMNRK